MPTTSFEDIFNSDSLTEAEKARLKAISAGIDRRTKLGLLGAMSTDEGLQRIASPLIQSGRDDRVQYGQRFDAEKDAAARLAETMQKAADRDEALAFRKQQQDDLTEYRRQTLGAADAARGAAADARSVAAEERADRTKRSEADRLRNEYEKRVGAQRTIGGTAEALLAATADPDLMRNPSAQTALVIQFGKMLDPGSVVREGEYKLFEQARSLSDTLKQFPEKVASGARLTPQQVQNMRQVAATIAQSNKEREAEIAKRYHGLATQRGYDPYEVVGDYDPASYAAPKPSVGGVPGVQPVAEYDANGRRVR